MKICRSIVFFVIFGCSLSVWANDPTHIFVTHDLKPTPYVNTLLNLTNLYDAQDNLADVVRKTQKAWIGVRQGVNKIERIDLVDCPRYQIIAKDVIAATKTQGLFEKQKPSQSHYRYALCHGAFLEGVRLRLAELVDAWKSGVRFDALVFLAGERDLRSGPGQPDDYANLCDPNKSPLPFRPDWIPPNPELYKLEYDMMRFVWEQVQIPAVMAAALVGKVTFINAPRGHAPRASTRDTFITWLKEENPEPGPCLAASHPMLWAYQQLIGQSILGPDFYLDTIAPEASEELLNRTDLGKVSVILDTIAKCLYEIERAENKE